MVSAMHVHLVFVTKYRRGVLTDEAIEIIRVTAKRICLKFDADLQSLDGDDDHVHLLVAYPPTVSISRLVNSLKGVTSRDIRSANLPEVRARLWGNHLWSPSYFAASCGGAPLDIIRAYVENQRVDPHA